VRFFFYVFYVFVAAAAAWFPKGQAFGALPAGLYRPGGGGGSLVF
jgi:hypothetical protein